jgi:hypothetical protein
MSELVPTQQQHREESAQVDLIHDAIRNNDMPPSLYFDSTPGRIEDHDKAEDMAYAAKPDIDAVLDVLKDRDHDILVSALGKIGTKDVAVPLPDGPKLVTKPRLTELRDDQGNATGRTGVRTEQYNYKDLKRTVQDANWKAKVAGWEYDDRKEETTPLENSTRR